MKKLILMLAMLMVGVQAYAYDITFDNNVVKIKKEAITQIYIKDGDLYDSYQSKWRDQETVTFKFVPYSGDPNGWKLLTAYKNYYKAPSGEESITYDGQYLSIPFSVWDSSSSIQIEPENAEAIRDLLDDILPLLSAGKGSSGFLTKHYFDYWLYRK